MKEIKGLLFVLLAIMGYAHGTDTLDTTPMEQSLCSSPCPRTHCNDYKFTEAYYVGITGGPNWFGSTGHKHQKIHADVGFAVGADFGYRFIQGIRAEVEIVYRHNNIDYIRYFSSNIDVGGSIWSISAFANGVFEMPWFREWSVTPYVGVGVGYTHMHINSDFLSNKNKDGFAWQFIAGVGYWFSASWDMAIEYRFRQGPVSYFYDQTGQFALKYHF